MRLFVFGDSIVEGYYDMEKGGWANLLKTYFWKNSNRVEVATLGISGDFVKDLINRTENEIKYFTQNYNDGIKIIFSIGINDTAIKKFEGNIEINNKENFKKQLIELISISKKYTQDISFIGLTNVNENLVNPLASSYTGKSYNNERIREFDNIIKEVCMENNLNYFPLSGLLNDGDLYDGLHPNSKGHAKIYEKVLEFIEEKGFISSEEKFY